MHRLSCCERWLCKWAVQKVLTVNVGTSIHPAWLPLAPALSVCLIVACLLLALALVTGDSCQLLCLQQSALLIYLYVRKTGQLTVIAGTSSHTAWLPLATALSVCLIVLCPLLVLALSKVDFLQACVLWAICCSYKSICSTNRPLSTCQHIYQLWHLTIKL